ncbi:MAG: TAXI family TRAP transporter solute-binding subunit [Ruminococcaceae bacterium]|nr:TAXI family TRAP transporter solute-binding subunit [Oscillospiraceae bacterium]
MKKFIAMIMALMMVMSLAACGGGNGGESKTKMRFVTGSESGTYYAFGSTIAQHATNNAKGIEVIGVVGNGSQANIQDLQNKKAELAFCQSDVMAYAYAGTNLFAKDGKVDCFSTVAALYMEQVQIVTCDPEIKTVADLKGKRVSIGASGSGVYFNALDVLGCYGLSESDIIPTYQGFGDSANALKDGQIDAAFVVSGAPTTAITELATTKTAYLVSIEDANVDKLLKASPYYSKAVIKAGTYTGQTADVTTVAVGAVVLARNDMPEDAIYALTADIFDNYTNLVSSHAKYGELSLEFATSVTSVPYHAGAAKYFAEKNITVPTAK